MAIGLWRLAAMTVTGAVYAAAVVESPQPLAMAVGLAPIAWIALEACWHLFDPGKGAASAHVEENANVQREPNTSHGLDQAAQ